MEAPAEDREAGLEVMEAASVEAREDTGVLMKTAGVHSEVREEDDTEARLEDREAMEVGKEAREVRWKGPGGGGGGVKEPRWRSRRRVVAGWQEVG